MIPPITVTSEAYHINVLDYVGKTINVYFETTSSGGRISALCNSNGIIYEKYTESTMDASGWDFEITAENHDLYISFDAVRASGLEVTISEEGVIPDLIGDEEIETEADTITGAIAELNNAMKIVKTLNDRTVTVELPQSEAGYYTGKKNESIVWHANNGTAYHVDISSLIGSQVNVSFTTTSTTGSRITALCNSHGIIYQRYVESEMSSDGWTFEPSEEYYDLYISFDTSRTSNLSVTSILVGKLDSIDERLDELETKQEGLVELVERTIQPGKTIQPKIFPTLPYEIIRQNGSYILKESIRKTKGIDGFKQLYVNSASGNDSNDGLSEGTAFKTLKKALTTFVSGITACCINIVNNAVCFADELYGECNVSKSLAIIAREKATLVNGINPNWVVDGTIYSAIVPDYTPFAVVNMSESNIDKNGVYSPLIICSSLEDCKATQNSFYIDGNTVYLNPQNAEALSDHIITITDYMVRWNHSRSQVSNFIYFENLNFIGANYNSARSSAFPLADLVIEMFSINNIYQHFRGDGATAQNYDVSYFVGCTSAYSQRDNFNTHNTVNGQDLTNNVCVTMNCNSIDAGYYAQQGQHGINNLFTSHNGENVLRINCHGKDSDGPCFADVNGCRSVYIDCSSVNTKYPDVAQTGTWQFNNSQATNDGGFVSLQNCMIYDNRNIPRIFSECDIEVSMIDLSNCNITGELSAFTSI